MKDVILLNHLNRNRWPRLWFLLLTAFGHFSLYAQHSVTGKVSDETGSGLPGVNIFKVGLNTMNQFNINDGERCQCDVSDFDL